MLDSFDRRLLVVLALSLSSSACTMNNPAFGETGESSSATASDARGDDTAADEVGSGEASSSDTGDGDGDGDASSGTDTADASTGDGDGDATQGTDTGDGDTADVDTGDGDADAGDGDGDTDPSTTGLPCQVVEIPVVADTFVVNGPQEGDAYCALGWQWQGAPGSICEHLNFGASEELWIGQDVNSEDLRSLFLARFNVDMLPAIGSFTDVTDVKLKVTIVALETVPEGTTLWADLMPTGAAGMWSEGDLNGEAPLKGDGFTTYKYQYFAAQPWPNNAPPLANPYPLGETFMGGLLGEHVVTIDIPATVANDWFVDDPVGQIANGFILGSNAPLFDLLLTTKDNIEGMAPPVLEMTVCL